ncbi:MAG TPA: ArgE/DapE family deacylase [Vicinamibacterales bacterium]|nr:ArgE/DapE family deacylase [Vicinamibacterales bacterium]
MDPVIRLLRDLVAINSVNPTLVPGAPGEREVAECVAAELRRSGLDVSVEPVADGRPNVIGVLEGRRQGPALMFCGHTDTVGVSGMTDPFTPIERDGRLYGRGAQDMKGGVAAMISAAAAVAQAGLDAGRLIVAAVVDEEHSSIGADALVKNWTADAGVVTEPTDLAIAVGHKGFAWVEVAVEGRAAHGSRPAEGRDAILRLGRVLARLEALDRELQDRQPHALVGTGSLHASFVYGGRELSSYPDRATLQMERRTLPGEAESIAVEELRAILAALAREDPTFVATVVPMFSRPAYEVPAGHQLPALMATALARAGGTPRIGGASFWTDAAVLGHAGIPSILFGPGGAGLHSTEEYVTIADVVACRDALVELTRAFFVRD